jgi:hypothetical protein
LHAQQPLKMLLCTVVPARRGSHRIFIKLLRLLVTVHLVILDDDNTVIYQLP